MNEIKKTLTEQVTESITNFRAGRKPNPPIILMAKVISTSETGHAVTIGQFRSMIDYGIAASIKWVPSNAAILIPALELQYTAANNAQVAVNTAHGVYGPNAQARAIAFQGVDALALSAKGLFFSSGVTKSAKTELEAVYRKMTGARKVAKVKNPPVGTPKNISVSQLSFDNRLDNFDKFIAILEGNSLYAPAEPEYTTIALRIVYNNMKTKNDAVKAAIIPLDAAMNLRNKLLYKDDVGVCDTITKLMKPYCLGIYQHDKPTYKKINHILIKKLAYQE